MESWARGNLSHRRLRGSSKMPRHKHTDPRYDGGQWLLKGAEGPCQPTASSLPERRCLSRKAPGDSGSGVAVLRASPCLATVAGGLNEARLLPRLLAPGQLLASPPSPILHPWIVGTAIDRPPVRSGSMRVCSGLGLGPHGEQGGLGLGLGPHGERGSLGRGPHGEEGGLGLGLGACLWYPVLRGLLPPGASPSHLARTSF